MFGRLKCAKSAISGISLFPMCWFADPLPIGTLLLLQSSDGTIRLCSTDWRTSRLHAGVRFIWPGMIPGQVSSKLSKLLNQEDALSAPCLMR
jgi:hypothetical protein